MTRIAGQSHNIPNMRINLLREGERVNFWSGPPPNIITPKTFVIWFMP